MTKNDNIKSALRDVVTLKQWSELNGHNDKHVRRLARGGNIPSAFQFGTKPARWYIARDATDTVPPVGTRGNKSRNDGRKRFTVYVNPVELALVADLVGAENVIDPRELARKKRAERKLTDDVALENDAN